MLIHLSNNQHKIIFLLFNYQSFLEFPFNFILTFISFEDYPKTISKIFQLEAPRGSISYILKSCVPFINSSQNNYGSKILVPRSYEAIESRFKTIKDECSLWKTCLNKANTRLASGTNASDVVSKLSSHLMTDE